MRKRIQFGMALLTLATSAVLADPPTLKVGDPAPKLQTGAWVQGDAVTDFQKDKAYVVEFWATWCGPCRASIPHLNEHFLKFKDKGLVVIGQDCWEEDDNLVAPFVKSMGDKMTYRVALDDKKSNPKGAMAQTWMAAAGQNAIPTAFVIGKDGRIAWMGHPMNLDDSILEAVLGGGYDFQKAAVGNLRREFYRARQRGNWDEALATLDEMEKIVAEKDRFSVEQERFQVFLGKEDYAKALQIAEQASDAHPENARGQRDLVWKIMGNTNFEAQGLPVAEKLAARAAAASTNRDSDILDTLAMVLFKEGKQSKAVKAEEQAAGVSIGEGKILFQKRADNYKKGLDAHAQEIKDQVHRNTLSQELAIALQNREWDEALARLDDIDKLASARERPELGLQRFSILISKEDFKSAYKLAAQLSEAQLKDADAQRNLAWKIVGNPAIAKPDLALAEKIAARAAAASENKDAEVLDTLACVYFKEGKKDRAAAMEETAAALLAGGAKKVFDKRAESYRNGIDAHVQEAAERARLDTLRQEGDAAVENKNWDVALAKMDAIEKLAPEAEKADLAKARFHLLLAKKDYVAAYKLAGELSDTHLQDADFQNELAWDIATDVKIEQRDLPLAEKMAARALQAASADATKTQNSEIIDTLATVLFMEGNQERAVTLEEKAAAGAEGDEQAMFQKTLEAFKKGTNKPDILNRQAQELRDDGKLAEAEAAFREELAVEQQLWPDNAARWESTVRQLQDILSKEHKPETTLVGEQR